jgi:hypothetical protein
MLVPLVLVALAIAGFFLMLRGLLYTRERTSAAWSLRSGFVPHPDIDPIPLVSGGWPECRPNVARRVQTGLVSSRLAGIRGIRIASEILRALD